MTTETACDTRQRIIEAGAQAMIAKSYNGTGLNEILQAAGVPKGSFYHFFKSKENLGIAVIEKSAADHLQVLRSFYSNRAFTPVQRLRNLYEWVRDEAAGQETRKECVICKLALEQAALSEPMRAAIRCCLDQTRALMAQVIREAQAAGEIDKGIEAEKLADFLRSSFDGVMIRVQIDGDVRPIDNFLHFVFDVLLR